MLELVYKNLSRLDTSELKTTIMSNVKICYFFLSEWWNWILIIRLNEFRNHRYKIIWGLYSEDIVRPLKPGYILYPHFQSKGLPLSFAIITDIRSESDRFLSNRILRTFWTFSSKNTNVNAQLSLWISMIKKL